MRNWGFRGGGGVSWKFGRVCGAEVRPWTIIFSSFQENIFFIVALLFLVKRKEKDMI